MSEHLVIAGRVLQSRLIIGTGKYPSHAIMKAAHEASGADMVTVAVRRVDISRKTESLLDYIDTSKIFLLPNTAACYTAEDAIRTARLGREAEEPLESAPLHPARGLRHAARMEVERRADPRSARQRRASARARP